MVTGPPYNFWLQSGSLVEHRTSSGGGNGQLPLRDVSRLYIIATSSVASFSDTKRLVFLVRKIVS